MTNVETETAPAQVLCVHTCWGLDHAEWVRLHGSTRLSDGTTRHDGTGCDGRLLHLTERPGGDLEPGWSNPCQCWDRDRSTEHPGHCCFAGEDCEHHELVRACEEQLPIGDLPMYDSNRSAW